MTVELYAGIGGGVLVAWAGVALYLATPHQRWGRLPASGRTMGKTGAGLLVAGMALLLAWAGTATAVFIGVTLLMTVWSIVPIAIAWWRGEKGARS
ncbi:hypothetical protein [Novosphingobium gossypii]|uniref:hypothetical protein n=1 Tax=Novosphingobium gossypii TaxID=1604774 RepID=UPI003D2091B7